MLDRVGYCLFFYGFCDFSHVRINGVQMTAEFLVQTAVIVSEDVESFVMPKFLSFFEKFLDGSVSSEIGSYTSLAFTFFMVLPALIILRYLR